MNWLVELGNQVRDELQRLADEKDSLKVNVRDLQGGCGIASVVLYKILNDLGIPTTIKCGHFYPPGKPRKDIPHCWVTILFNKESYLLDVTATQFNKHHDKEKYKKDVVLIREKDSVSNWKADENKTFPPGRLNDVKNHFYGWPEGIQPKMGLVHDIIKVSIRMQVDL